MKRTIIDAFMKARDEARAHPRKAISLAVFILVSLAQLGLCASIVAGNERILARGRIALLRVEGVDPLDPFRGRYLAIRLADFDADDIEVPEWLSGSPSLILTLEEDGEGASRPDEAIADSPENRARLDADNELWFTLKRSSGSSFEPALDRFYVNEAEAPLAESLFNEAETRMLKVRIKSGEMNIEDLLLDGKSIRERIEEAGRK